ncbi:MAG: bacillithiol biosynthesis cysteine-adding enzyme BshC [Moraxellaceae bacterium]
MKVSHIPRKLIPQFSSFSTNFGKQDYLEQFLQQPFSDITCLNKQIMLKKEQVTAESRNVLVDTLQQQIGHFCSPKQQENIDLLAHETTFTITTGHQLTLFGGPLYLVYKVLHVVRLCELHNQSTTSTKIVPVFWMASEDHDFEEVRHARVFQHKLSWESEQSGAVGRFELNDFSQIYHEFAALFEGKETAIQDLLQLDLSRSYADFNQEFLTKLFSDFGVLVLQPDAPSLKEAFRTVIARELFEQPSFAAVSKTNEALATIGLAPQATAREINLFYLSKGKRKRIVREDDLFRINDRLISREELEQLLAEEIANFSPNVILRPVYQETILPNLAYIGGGGEMAYWVQLKQVFEAHNTLFPLIQQRNSLLLLDANTAKKVNKTNWEVARFFTDKQTLIKEYLAEQPDMQLDFSNLSAAFASLEQIMQDKTKEVDEALSSFANAESVRIKNQLTQFEAKLIKQQKAKHEQQLAALEHVSERFLPANELQERALHWLNFAPTGDYHSLFASIYAAIDPFQNDLIVLDLSVD